MYIKKNISPNNVSGEFPCDFDLEMYPFDIQRCYINKKKVLMTLKKKNKKENEGREKETECWM